jgi:hypothetical protein
MALKDSKGVGGSNPPEDMTGCRLFFCGSGFGSARRSGYCHLRGGVVGVRKESMNVFVEYGNSPLITVLGNRQYISRESVV